ncbi:AAA family ATPase [Phytoactinopolyspora limicola]|uniref:AAA family ATPase n=1 Tax=Phytoactinopolyspora limicola TaxID=2715536 RepID=UPI001A9C53F9|nr:AAA family ATPase [Phytoactinopolyspora limicola]
MLVVLVNGIPGSGKSTLARALASSLDLPLFSKDSVKETLADMLGGPPDGMSQRRWSQLLGSAAGETLWTLLADTNRGAVLESPWLAPLRSVAAAGLERAGVRHVHEVWCQVAVKLARQRYEARASSRHVIHDDGRVDDEQWRVWAGQAEPLGLGPVHGVDTTRPVDVVALARRITMA